MSASSANPELRGMVARISAMHQATCRGALSRLGRCATNCARPGRVQGTRELVVPATPFIVVYRIEATGVVILRVLHGAQKWPPG